MDILTSKRDVTLKALFKVIDLQEFLFEKSRWLLISPLDTSISVKDPRLVKLYFPAKIGMASSSLIPLMRLNFVLYLCSALILRWENKIAPAHFSSTIEEIIKKLKVWSPLDYGEFPHVIGNCCDGRKRQWLKFFLKDKVDIVELISKQNDLWKSRSIVELLYNVVQMHCLL